MITKAFNIVGFPGETKEEFEDTIRLNFEILPDIFTLTVFDPYLGRRLYEICKKKGYLTERGPTEGFVPRTNTSTRFTRFSE